jgi:CheY-like chemotaxis protein
MMPDLDGFEVARLLQQDARTAGAKVVIMTAMHRAAEYAQELGAAGYILKPFDVSDLLHAVQDVEG